MQALDLGTLKNEVPDFQGKPLLIRNLARNPGFSTHLVWIRSREEPHIHATHDATVLLVKGRGILNLAGRDYPMAAGSLVSIPQGKVHAFVNTEAGPALAYVIFSPPFDGKDIVPVPAE